MFCLIIALSMFIHMVYAFYNRETKFKAEKPILGLTKRTEDSRACGTEENGAHIVFSEKGSLHMHPSALEKANSNFFKI